MSCVVVQLVLVDGTSDSSASGSLFSVHFQANSGAWARRAARVASALDAAEGFVNFRGQQPYVTVGLV